LQMYRDTVQDLLMQQVVDVASSFEFFRKLRQELQIQDSDHFDTIESIATIHPELLLSAQARQASTQIQDADTLAKTVAKTVSKRRSNSRH
jgi:hypothetical protein